MATPNEIGGLPNRKAPDPGPSSEDSVQPEARNDQLRWPVLHEEGHVRDRDQDQRQDEDPAELIETEIRTPRGCWLRRRRDRDLSRPTVPSCQDRHDECQGE